MAYSSVRRNVYGMTLIEVLIVIAIVAIIAAVAYPSYQDSVRKSRRSDAKVQINQAAALQEKWYFTQNQYSLDLNTIGGASSPQGHYDITVDTSPCGGTAADIDTCFRIVATATGDQLNDTECRFFTLDSTGAKGAFDDGGGNTEAVCW